MEKSVTIKVAQMKHYKQDILSCLKDPNYFDLVLQLTRSQDIIAYKEISAAMDINPALCDLKVNFYDSTITLTEKPEQNSGDPADFLIDSSIRVLEIIGRKLTGDNSLLEYRKGKVIKGIESLFKIEQLVRQFEAMVKVLSRSLAVKRITIDAFTISDHLEKLAKIKHSQPGIDFHMLVTRLIDAMSGALLEYDEDADTIPEKYFLGAYPKQPIFNEDKEVVGMGFGRFKIQFLNFKSFQFNFLLYSFSDYFASHNCLTNPSGELLSNLLKCFKGSEKAKLARHEYIGLLGNSPLLNAFNEMDIHLCKHTKQMFEELRDVTRL